MAETYTYLLDEKQQSALLEVMANGNYRRREVPYSLMSIAGEGFNCTLYSRVTGGKRKCCIQGAKAEDFVLFELEPKVTLSARIGYEKVVAPEMSKPHGGCDESGKGDYFGPLVAVCCYVDEGLANWMREIGVKDCKKMSDKAILTVGTKLRRHLGPSKYAVVRCGPAAYNRLYAKMGNLNTLLAWAHATCIEALLERQPTCPRVVVDQFATTEATVARALKERGRRIMVEQRHKAEDDVAVAAASVIAREYFLRHLIGELQEYGFDKKKTPSPVDAIPKGSSDPRIRKLAEKCVREKGPAWIMDHCKAHFQTTDKVLSACGYSRDDLPPDGRVVSRATF